MISAALAQHLSDNVAGCTFDPDGDNGNVFCGFMPSTPDVAVMIDVPTSQPQPTRLPTDLPQPHLLVRGSRQNQREAYDLARAIYAECACLDLVTMAAGTVDEVFVIGTTPAQSGPVDIGQDDNQRFTFSLNFDMRVAAQTTHRQTTGA